MGEDDLDGPDETGGGSGFRLKCHEGIFKRISERARLDQGDSDGSQRLDRSARIFKIALGQRHVEDDRIRYGLDNDLIHIGWGDDIDWSDERFDEFNEIFSEWRSKKNQDASFELFIRSSKRPFYVAYGISEALDYLLSLHWLISITLY